jgi:trehalose 6-phosphate phosphatase
MSETRFRIPFPRPSWAYFLDVDGTLLEFAPHPRDVRATQELSARLQRLYEVCGGAVALVSGRRIEDIDDVFPDLRVSVAGQHGFEQRVAGTHRAPTLSAGLLDDARRMLTRVTTRRDGLHLEDKHHSLALHYRAAPALERHAQRAVRLAHAASGDSFTVQIGKCVIELKPRGTNKGTAVIEFMRHPPFAGRLPVFIGDDVTDEDGFAAVAMLGGHAVKVGAGPTCAPWRLPDVTAVNAWLARLTDESHLPPEREEP